jgi:hypothetical protein
MGNDVKMCEVCKSNDLVTVLDLGSHPLCDDLLKIDSSEVCEEFKIEIALCNHCLTAHQLHPVPKRKLFPSSYHYRSSMTGDVLDGMKGLVARVNQKFGDLSRKVVVDIGCNDGSLLKFFRDAGASVLGVEPTGAAKEAVSAGIKTINTFFDTQTAQEIIKEVGYPDFITFTNVFAHIEDMNGLLEAVKIMMGKNTHLIVENHYLGAVLDRYQFDTFYHEHPRTYSAHSFMEVAKRLGKEIEFIEFPARYGGNIRVIIGPDDPSDKERTDLEIALENEKDFLLKFNKMKSAIEIWVTNREKLLDSVRDHQGEIYCKAFPGRATILIKLLGLSNAEIKAVFEKPNSMKNGKYIPGTRIPIISEELMLKMAPPPRPILNFAWHISEEINDYMRTLDKGYVCVDIFSPDEFKRKVE